MQIQSKYSCLKSDYISHRDQAKNSYDFYNLIEKSILEMEGEDSNRISDSILEDNGLKRAELQKLV
jgi:hypothetical protein